MVFLQAIVLALRAVIFVMQVTVLLRVFCELMVIKRDSVPMRFIIMVSEPLLLPVRNLLSRDTKGKKLKLDISPFVVVVILYLINLAIKQSIL